MGLIDLANPELSSVSMKAPQRVAVPVAGIIFSPGIFLTNL